MKGKVPNGNESETEREREECNTKQEWKNEHKNRVKWR